MLAKPHALHVGFGLVLGFIVTACSDVRCFERGVHRQRIIMCSHAFVAEAYLPCTRRQGCTRTAYLRGQSSAAAPCTVCRRHYGRAACDCVRRSRHLLATRLPRCAWMNICYGACMCFSKPCCGFIPPRTCTLSHLVHCVCVDGVGVCNAAWGSSRAVCVQKSALRLSCVAPMLARMHASASIPPQTHRPRGR